MRLAIGTLVIALVVMLDSIECSGQGTARGSRTREELGNSNDDGILYPPPPHLRRQPEPFPETFIHYPYPYYYDEHGVIRDYMNSGSEGIVVHNMLVGMRRANGRHYILTRRGRQYIMDLDGGRIIFQEPGARPAFIGVGAPPYRRPHPAPNTLLRPSSFVPSSSSGMNPPSFSGQGNPSSSQGHPSSTQGHPPSSQGHPSSSQGQSSNSQYRPSSSQSGPSNQQWS